VGSPPALGGVALTYDPAQGTVILFGGAVTVNAAINVTWSYHAGVWTNITTTVGHAPSPREFPAMTYDSTDRELVLTGGLSGSGRPIQGTWVFKGAAWTNVTSTAPIPAVTVGPMLADDPSQSGVLLSTLMSYSNSGGAPYYMGTFLFTGGLYQNLTSSLPTHPPPIYIGSMNYVSPTEGIILVSGEIANATGVFVGSETVTWQYLNGAWTNITAAAGGVGRVGLDPAAAVDPVDHSIIQFGRIVEPIQVGSPETWALSTVPSVDVTATPLQTDVGGSVSFTSTVSLGLSPNSIAWNFGDGGTSTAGAPSHTFLSSGLYGVIATVTDLAGRFNASSVGVQVNALPTAAITPNVEGTDATLVATVTGGTAPYTFSWNLGDGTSASTMVVTHSYAPSTSYTVHLTVTDAAGKTTSATVTVTVGSSSSTGSSGVDLTSGLGLGLLAGIIVLAAIAAVLGFLLVRKPKSPSPPTPYVATGEPPAPSSSGPSVPPPVPPGAGG
jgi:PKD repeat protein